MQFLYGLLGFTITIGILVVIHEYGHFFVARCFNVKILRFSLGFGKPLLTWRGKRDGTLYTLAPIPLGGFVQMLGEHEDEEVAPEDRGRTFKDLCPWKRFLVAFAGPAVNLLFAVVVFALLFMTGVRDLRPEVAFIAPDSMAEAAGLRVGDELVAIDGTKTPLFPDAQMALVNAPNGVFDMDVVGKDGQERRVQLDFSTRRAGDEFDLGALSGMYLFGDWLPARVKEVSPASAAERMGVQAGDEIMTLDGKFVDILRLSRLLQDRAGKTVDIGVWRDGGLHDLSGKLGSRTLENGQEVGFLGVQWQTPPFEAYMRTERYGLFASLSKGVEKTLYYVYSTYHMFGRLIRGEMSMKNVGGPILIGDISGKAIQIGLEFFLNFLGLISLSLAAINLLPIPMLDGGHMLFSLIEMLRGKPLQPYMMEWLYRFGGALILCFMIFVIFMDVSRYV